MKLGAAQLRLQRTVDPLDPEHVPHRRDEYDDGTVTRSSTLRERGNLGLAIFSAISATLLGLAVFRPYAMFVIAFLLGGFPLMLLVGTGTFYAALGNMNAQAAYSLLLLLASIIVLLRYLSVSINLVVRFWVISAFILFATCSLVWGSDLLNGMRMLAKLATPFLFFWALAALPIKQSQVTTLENCLYGACIVSICLALVNLLTGGALAAREQLSGLFGLPALSAPYTSAANFSFLIMVGALAAYSRFLSTRSLLALALFGFFVASVIFAFVRITFAATLIGIVVIHFQSARKSAALALLAVMAMLLPLAVTSDALAKRMFFDPARANWGYVFSNPKEFFANVDTSGRTQLWSHATQHFSDSQNSIGAGVGSVESWIASQRGGGSQLHSEFLRTFFDLGWIGLLILLTALLQVGLTLQRYAASLRRRNLKVPIMLRAAPACLAAYVVTLATDNSFNYVAEFSVYVFGLAALSISAARISVGAQDQVA